MYRTTRNNHSLSKKNLKKNPIHPYERNKSTPDWLLKKLMFPLSQSRFSLVFPVGF